MEVHMSTSALTSLSLDRLNVIPKPAKRPPLTRQAGSKGGLFLKHMPSTPLATHRTGSRGSGDFEGRTRSLTGRSRLSKREASIQARPAQTERASNGPNGSSGATTLRRHSRVAGVISSATSGPSPPPSPPSETEAPATNESFFPEFLIDFPSSTFAIDDFLDRLRAAEARDGRPALYNDPDQA